MAKYNSIKINAIFNAIYQVLVLIIPVITIPYVSRVLGQNAIGEYSLFSSIINYFVLFASYGFVDYGTKVISENRDNLYEKSRSFFSVLFTKAILTVGTLLVFFIYLLLSGYTGIQFYSFIGLSLYIFAVLFDPTFYFQGEERFVSISIRNAIVRVIIVILTFVLIKSEDDLGAYCFILGLGQLLSTLIMYFSFKKGELLRVKVKDLDIISTIKKAFPFFIPCVAIQLYTGINQLILDWFNIPASENGFYGQAFKVVQLLSALPGSITIIMYSRVSYLLKINDKVEAEKKIIQTFQVFWILSLSISFGVAGISKTFVPVFFGDGYEKVIYILYLLCPSIIVTPLNTLFSYLFFKPTNKAWIQTLILFISSIIDIALASILATNLMSYGVAIARCVGDLIQIPLLVLFSRKQINFRDIIKTLLKPLASSLVMFAFVYFLQYVFSITLGTHFISLFLLILFGAIIFYIVEILLKEEFVVNYSKMILIKISYIFKKIFRKN